MNVKAVIKKVVSHSNSGQFLEVEKLCRQILRKKPQNHYALHNLGLALHNIGKYKEAIPYFKKALKQNKVRVFVFNNLGCTYLETKEFSDAASCFKRSIILDPREATYFTNLGLALFQQKKYAEAQAQYEKAIRLNNNSAKAMVYLGVCLQRLGEFDEAVKWHLRANDLDPSLAISYVHLFNALSFSHVTDDALHVAQSGLQYTSSAPAEQLELLIGIAKNGWLSGQVELVRDAIRKSKSIPPEKVINYGNIKSLSAYQSYISRLLKIRRGTPGLYDGDAQEPMFFVGDSHCLSPSETVVVYNNVQFRVLSTLIQGCKAWHLSRADANECKSSLKRLFRALPPRSHVVMGMGEIDCRADEGILVAYIDKGIDFHSSVPAFVDLYVAFVTEMAEQCKHRLIFYGVPASNIEVVEALSPERAELLQKIISLFNKELKKAVTKRNLEFLDVYSLTKKSQSFHNSDVYLDKFHLHPETLKNLFRLHLISPQ